MEIFIVTATILFLLTVILGVVLISRAIILVRDDMQTIIKAMSIDIGHNKRGADNIEKIAKLSG
jgi:hypothetical protein